MNGDFSLPVRGQNIKQCRTSCPGGVACSGLGGRGRYSGLKQAGLPTVEDKSQPLPLMRQVQIAARLLILCGVVLGYTLSSGFFLLSGFVGAGLLFAGLTGFCGMARLLKVMPWNRHTS